MKTAFDKTKQKLLLSEIKEFLDQKYVQYNTKSFIDTDPIAVPHGFSKLQDIEIAAFFSSTFAWGNRKIIINKSNLLMNLMDNEPYEFVCHANKNEMATLNKFVHRTINANDVKDMLMALRKLYQNSQTLEIYFMQKGNSLNKITFFRNEFIKRFSTEHAIKHISNPINGSAAKRLCMFLRWMVRKDKNGVDFGLWKNISTKDLIIPLDLHSGNTARKLNLLKRKQNDAFSAIELTNTLKSFDCNDPVKYDFALFGLGIFEKF